MLEKIVQFNEGAMKNPGASSWVSSLDRKFIVQAMVHTPIRKSVYIISWGSKFPEQAPGHGPSLPIKNELKELVRTSVEETLNGPLDQEAEQLTGAARYEWTEQRQAYRKGSYRRNLATTSGEVTLKVPKLKDVTFEAAIIERYRRRESSVEEALIEMYLAGVSVRRVERI
jgi:hypothetical protein